MDSHFDVIKREESEERKCLLDVTQMYNTTDCEAEEDKSVAMTTRRGRKRKRHLDSENIDPETETESPEQEQKRLLSNSQERCRMDKLNKALNDLRKCLPQQFLLCNRRMSKIRTLRLAMRYITTLSDLINKDDRRREEMYRRTLLSASVPTPTTPDFYKYSPQHEPRLSGPDTPVINSQAYHPYYNTLQELSADSNLQQSPYQTPPENHLEPRYLDFFRQTYRTPSEVPKLMDDILDATMFARRPVNAMVYTPLMSSDVKSITSPFVGTRNFNEHDSSYLGNTSDICREEGTPNNRTQDGIKQRDLSLPWCFTE